MRIGLIGGVSALALTTAALAVSSSIPTLGDINFFATGTAPDSVTKKAASTVEKPAVISNGSNYAVISGVVDGVAGGALNSYIRLFNGGAAPATISVTVVNATTGATVGSTTYTIPALASQQYAMGSGGAGTNILSKIAPATAAGGTYSVYLQSSESTAGYQHVTYNGVTFLYENASVCKNLLSQVTLPYSSSLVLLNVHTSVIEAFGYPMSISLHNFSDVTKTYVVKVYEASGGTFKGQTTLQAQANTSYSLGFVNQIQKASTVNWTPLSSEGFANVVITDSSGATPNAMIGSSIDTSSKLGAGAASNMSMACAINAATTSTGGGDGGFGGGSTY